MNYFPQSIYISLEFKIVGGQKMPKNKLNKYSDLYQKIMDCLQESDHVTTRSVTMSLRDKGLKPSWETVKDYLEDMYKQGLVNKKEFSEGKNIVCVWIKEVRT